MEQLTASKILMRSKISIKVNREKDLGGISSGPSVKDGCYVQKIKEKRTCNVSYCG